MLTEILRRQTTRSFMDEVKDFKDYERIQKMLKDVIILPFHPVIKVSFIEAEDELRRSILKHADYGRIKGSPQVLAFYGRASKKSFLNLGYYLSYLTLKATKMDFATAILGGDFTEELQSFLRIEEDQVVPILLCIGRPDKETKKDMKVDRKRFEEIHFQRSLDYSMTQEVDEHLKVAMNAMRYAPSSENQQPWRTIIEGSTLHFYLNGDVHEDTNLKDYIDMGLALHHLIYQLESYGITSRLREIPRGSVRNATYVISVVTKKE